MPDTEPDIRSLIDNARAQAQAEATRADGTVDAYVEALAFRRLVVEAAAEWPDSAEPPSGG